MNSTSNPGFGPVLAVRSLLSALTVPYWIAGGWAIDLAVGRVTRDHADVTRHRDGIPFLAPEVALLFEARSTSDKDQHDVETALPVLSVEQRSWLQDTLESLPRGQAAPVPRPSRTQTDRP